VIARENVRVEPIATARRIRRAVALAFLAAAANAAAGGSAAVAQEAEPTAAAPCSIVATLQLPAASLGGGSNGGPGVALGGMSDLCPEPGGSAGATLRLWAVTDRGPNGTVKSPTGKRRTLLAPDFVPTIVSFDLERDPSALPRGVALAGTTPLAGRTGRPLSGRPNGIGNDEPILDAAGEHAVATDPNGIDSEGLIRLRDGSFWMAEEYRPSLLEVSAEGRVFRRYVPRGHSLPQADMAVVDVLPAEYGSRRDNRGFEALAVSPDESRLWALVQSPLDHPRPKTAKDTGNVRLLAFDLRTKRPAAEHLYRLGDPADPNYLTKGAPPADGKLCAMAALGADSLLVLEQSEEGLARLYRCSLAAASDTLGRAADAPALEEIADLAAAGIVPVTKRLVADLAPLRPRMISDVYRDAVTDPAAAELKLEGLAVVGPRQIAIVNDNDFGVHTAGAPPRSCLWIIELPSPMTGDKP
jgi:hypothetical protein